MSEIAPRQPSNRLVQAVSSVGDAGYAFRDGLAQRVRYLGGVAYLLGDTCVWAVRGLVTKQVKLSRTAVVNQMVRVGVRSLPIIILVQTFIGIILALQMAPTLRQYGSLDKVANIVGIAMFRELGPLLSAVVLSGYAGASIAAEIGAMVEAEEIKALRAHALNPIRFLVVPRFLATVIMTAALAVAADVVGVLGGLLTSWAVLDINPYMYLENTRVTLVYKDFLTGLLKAGVFGMLISMIACYEGLNVTGGAEGVGRGTTSTVVKSIVALIATDCVFTTAFYLFGL